MITAFIPNAEKTRPGQRSPGRMSYCPRVAAPGLGQEAGSLDPLAAKERTQRGVTA